MAALSIQIRLKRNYDSSVNTDMLYMELRQLCQYRYVVKGTMTAPSIQIRRKRNYNSSVNTDILYMEL